MLTKALGRAETLWEVRRGWHENVVFYGLRWGPSIISPRMLVGFETDTSKHTFFETFVEVSVRTDRDRATIRPSHYIHSFKFTRTWSTKIIIRWRLDEVLTMHRWARCTGSVLIMIRMVVTMLLTPSSSYPLSPISTPSLAPSPWSPIVSLSDKKSTSWSSSFLLHRMKQYDNG